MELCAPFGLSDLLGGVVRANKIQIRRQIYEQKVSRWLKVWPKLSVVDWD
ncbi:nucleotidyltransferase family protein [Rhizobium leguminosarum]